MSAATHQKTATARKVWLPKHGRWVHFTHRDAMARKRPMAKATLPKAVPPTTLPIDCTGGATVSCPMLGNDQVGDCGPVMMAHKSQVLTYGQGKAGFSEISINQAALIAQYEQKSGGDNGTDEDMLVGPDGIATAAGGGVAGDPSCIVEDHLDVDCTDVALMDYVNDRFYGFQMAWSVPDAFLQTFAQGEVFAKAGVPNPSNGHYTLQADVAGPTDAAAGTPLAGFYRIWTWGSWCWASPEFIASVQPQAFVTFSAQQFRASDGYDSHGRHVSDVAADWVAIGGNASIVASVVAKFPPKAAPPAPSPTPSTTAPTLAEAIAWAGEGIDAAPDALETRDQAKAALAAGLTAHWPATAAS